MVELLIELGADRNSKALCFGCCCFCKTPAQQAKMEWGGEYIAWVPRPPFDSRGAILELLTVTETPGDIAMTETPGDIATKHPGETSGDFYTRREQGLTYEEYQEAARLRQQESDAIVERARNARRTDSRGCLLYTSPSPRDRG